MTPSKKRKAANSEASSKSHPHSSSNKKDNQKGFTPFSLEDIRSKIESLSERVPQIPENKFVSSRNDGDDNGDGSNLDETAIRNWAAQLQAVLEEFNLIVCCVSTATYKWGTDRSGAADQNLSLLSGEIQASQDQISATVSPRISNVLAPVNDLVVDKVTIKKSENEELRQNHYTRHLVDPDFLKLCHTILVRNAPLLRHVVLANFDKVMKALKDYIHAMKQDSDTDRGFAY